MSVDPQAAIAAFIVACGGTWWFYAILTNIRKMPMATRLGVYALVWLAYFIVTMLIIGQSTAGGQ